MVLDGSAISVVSRIKDAGSMQKWYALRICVKQVVRRHVLSIQVPFQTGRGK